MNRLKVLLILALITVLALPLAIHAQGDDLPEIVLAQRADYFPEGVDWDPLNERFLTGSIAEGGVFTVADDGTVERLADQVEDLSSIGIHVDADDARVLVALTDVVDADIAALGAYDLHTGEELFVVDLTDLYDGRHFANDVTVDDEGNAYVTDSFSPVIYKVTPDGSGEIFLQSDEFDVTGFALNGIDYHPDGYLLAAVAGKAALYRVPLDDPAALTPVKLSPPVSMDGMVLGEDGYLYAVSGNREVVVIASEDDWTSADVIARESADGMNSPTTLALRDGAAYVIHAHFNAMQSNRITEAFEIVRFDFDLDEVE
ncbi:MAG: SMP-30/gluconolactonase/LRE family protein [Anaerolineae bacterium]|nr:SMP-30/gluconolactonase/LRE family protein [Anaerolineae bacterium]